ncbi:hypothetical protein ACFV6E_27720 [Streptomyces sp. NPDC059785]|uniref:hypothetical protein n=1 Tax=Streptomyces sp. NPDC059785 TaxID=3346945 RepID=UPI00364714E7
MTDRPGAPRVPPGAEEHASPGDLAALALDGARSPRTAGLELHLSRCALCRTVLAELRRAVTAGRDASPADTLLTPPSRVWDAISTEMRGGREGGPDESTALERETVEPAPAPPAPPAPPTPPAPPALPAPPAPPAAPAAPVPGDHVEPLPSSGGPPSHAPVLGRLLLRTAAVAVGILIWWRVLGRPGGGVRGDGGAGGGGGGACRAGAGRLPPLALRAPGAPGAVAALSVLLAVLARLSRLSRRRASE